jgi:hypothetical protein
LHGAKRLKKRNATEEGSNETRIYFGNGVFSGHGSSRGRSVDAAVRRSVAVAVVAIVERPVDELVVAGPQQLVADRYRNGVSAIGE